MKFKFTLYAILKPAKIFFSVNTLILRRQEGEKEKGILKTRDKSCHKKSF